MAECKRLAGRCFNAATTRRPWRTPGNSCREGRPSEPASMRPRPEGRGERPWSARLRRTAPSFNAATTRRPWRTDWTRFGFTTEDWLQCGHDPKAVENLYYAAILTQHGTCFNAATTRRPWRTSTNPRPVGGLTQVFNAEAATTRRPWRTLTTPDCGGGWTLRLQRGHDPKAVENLHCPVCTQPQVQASMRPRPEGRGDPHGRGQGDHRQQRFECGHDPKAVETAVLREHPPGTGVSFNAATTRRPWRT